MINIKTTKKGNGLSTSEGIEITDKEGNPIKKVFGLNIDIAPMDIIRARVEIGVGELNLQAEEDNIYIDDEGNKYKALSEFKLLEQRVDRLQSLLKGGGRLKT